MASNISSPTPPMASNASTPDGSIPGPPASLHGLFARIRQRAFRTDPADASQSCCVTAASTSCRRAAACAFLGTLVMMLITSLNYALSLGFAVTFLLSPALVAAALLHTFRNLAGLELAAAGAAGETFAGNPLPFTIARRRRATARGTRSRSPPVPRRLTVGYRRPGNAVPVTLTLPSSAVGRSRSGASRSSSPYPLGLWRGWAYIHFPLTGHRVFQARSRCAAAAGRHADDAQQPNAAPRRRWRARWIAHVPARRSDAARGLEGRRARRRLAHQGVRGSGRRRTGDARLESAAAGLEPETQTCAPRRRGCWLPSAPRGRSRSAIPGIFVAGRSGSSASARGVDGARAVRGASVMPAQVATPRPTHQRRSPESEPRAPRQRMSRPISQERRSAGSAHY